MPSLRPPALALAWSGLFLLFLACTVRVYVEGAGPSVPVADATVRKGVAIWQANNCQACHQIYGLGGYKGPDLTNTQRTWGADYIGHFIRNGGRGMPAFALAEDEVEALIAFLAWVDASGRNRVPADAVHWTGSYAIGRD